MAICSWLLWVWLFLLAAILALPLFLLLLLCLCFLSSFVSCFLLVCPLGCPWVAGLGGFFFPPSSALLFLLRSYFSVLEYKKKQKKLSSSPFFHARSNINILDCIFSVIVSLLLVSCLFFLQVPFSDLCSFIILRYVFCST